jgi:hypothetical protein
VYFANSIKVKNAVLPIPVLYLGGIMVYIQIQDAGDI